MDPEEIHLKQIRTFQGDVAEALQREHESLVSIQQAEYLKKSSVQSDTNTHGENSKKRAELFNLLLGSLILFTLGTVGVWYAYNEFVRRSATPIMTAPANRFVSVDDEVNLNFTATSRETLINTLSDAVQGVTARKIRHVVFTKKEGVKEMSYLFPTSEFLKMLEARAPASLVRAFDPLFMFGAFGESTFLIIKLTSFENAFAGMLAWEKNLSQDIGPLFATAELSRNVPLESVFTDITDKNKDVRMLALKDQPILLYSFFDNNMLIITDNIETLRMLVDRLTREKLSR
ncbi:MAG: hypothetical protein Q7R89_00765 [bacterium]|nr:hypothetical protein [bacterium]